MGNWFGSKATSGLCQPIIALMPPHDTYIETHLGGGAIMRRKPAARHNVGIDLDSRAIERFHCDYPVETIRDIDISPGLFADGPWGAELVTVEGDDLLVADGLGAFQRLGKNGEVRGAPFRTAEGWTYGMAELDAEQAEKIASAQFVANPGCWPQGGI